MAKELEMGGVETLELPVEEDAVENVEEISTEETQATDSKTDDDEDSSSFLDTMRKHLEGEPESKEPEPEPEPAQEPEESMKESRSSSDFKKIKEDRDNARQELSELKAKLESLDNSDVDNLLESVTKERDDLSARLRLASIERHPNFQKEYQSKIDGIVARAKKLVGADHGDRVADLLAMSDSDYRSNGLEEVMLDLPTSKQAQLGAMLAGIEEVRSAKEDALANSEETYKQMLADQAAQRESVMGETYKTFDSALGEASQLEIFQKRDDDEGWNGQVNERIELARNIFSGENDAKDLARASLWAAAAPAYRELLATQIELNRRLRAQLKDQSAATPGVTGTGGGKPATEKDFLSEMEELMRG